MLLKVNKLILSFSNQFMNHWFTTICSSFPKLFKMKSFCMAKTELDWRVACFQTWCINFSFSFRRCHYSLSFDSYSFFLQFFWIVDLKSFNKLVSVRECDLNCCEIRLMKDLLHLTLEIDVKNHFIWMKYGLSDI